MYLMYVDESGDCGMPSDGSPTRYFCLSGLVVHETRWKETMADLLRFRHWLKNRYGVYLDDEIHTANLISRPRSTAASFQRLRKHQRLAIIRNFADQIARLSNVRIINVVVDKHGKAPNKEEVFRWAWYSLFQRFENTILNGNFPGPGRSDDCGLVFPDNTDGGKLKGFLNDMRVKNLLKVKGASGAFSYKDEPIKVIIEDAVVRDSRESYLIQSADCAVYLLKQNVEPNGYMRKHGGNAYFCRLDPVHCSHASKKDRSGRGVVRL